MGRRMGRLEDRWVGVCVGLSMDRLMVVVVLGMGGLEDGWVVWLWWVGGWVGCLVGGIG